MVNRDEGNGGNGSSDHDHPPTQEPVGNCPGRVAGAQYYQRTLLQRLERDRKEYARLSRRLYHNGRVILEAWVALETRGVGSGKSEYENVTLDELEIWEDLWIALWRKRRRLSRTIKALIKEIADIDGNR